MVHIHIFQHVPFETPALIEQWAQYHQHTITTTYFYEGLTLPDLDSYDALIIMGGPMSANDEIEFPWLIDEKKHIKSAIDAQKHVLGICLGGQLIAQVLDAQVIPHTHQEIGWFPIQTNSSSVLTHLNNQTVFHWHGERFDIPKGAIHLVKSEACDNQAFSYNNRVLALQFHLEMDKNAIERIIDHCYPSTSEAYIQSKEHILSSTEQYVAPAALDLLLTNWLK